VDAANSFTVILDACVLYSAIARDIVLCLADEQLFRPRWTEQIHAEWIEALLERRPDIDRDRLERLRDKLNDEFLDSLVTGHEPLIEALQLPDPDDRHVLAAAIHARADAIVTFNVEDFPEESLKGYAVEVIDPDDFVIFQLDLERPRALRAAKACRANLKKPALTVEQFIASLASAGFPQTAAELRKYRDFI
jgi:predicted nucleic acid-binding protein